MGGGGGDALAGKEKKTNNNKKMKKFRHDDQLITALCFFCICWAFLFFVALLFVDGRVKLNYGTG